MESTTKRLPKPNIQREYERIGANYYFKNGYWTRSFDEMSLKRFYTRDVLIHELGHHVDRKNNKDYNAKERFAEWFVEEYGFRLW